MKDLRDEVQQPWLALFWQLILKGLAPAKYVTGFRVHQKSALGWEMGHVLIFLNSKTSPSLEQESGTTLFNIKEVSKAPFTKNKCGLSLHKNTMNAKDIPAVGWDLETQNYVLDPKELLL